MTDTTRITLGTRYAETGRVLLRISRTMWGDDPEETATFHDLRAARGEVGHAALAVMRSALDEAEAAGIDITPVGGVRIPSWGLGIANGVDLPPDKADRSPTWRAARYLFAEVLAVKDNPEALAALPYDVRDHRTPTVPADQPRPAGIPNGDVTWVAADETAASIAAAFSIGEYPVPDHVSAVFATAEDDEPASGEHPPVTAHDLAAAGVRTITATRSGTASRAFPPAPPAATDTPEEQARKLLEYHTRRDAGGCACGWNVWGSSFAQHLVATLAGSGLLYGDRERRQLADAQADPTEFAALQAQVRRQEQRVRDRQDTIDGQTAEIERLQRVLIDASAARDNAWAEIARLNEFIHRGQVMEPEDGEVEPKPTPSPLTVALAENLNATLDLWVRQLNAATTRAREAASALPAPTDTTPEQQP